MTLPARIAAVPAYIPSNGSQTFADAAPGHRFLGYLRNWQGSGGQPFAPYKGKVHVDKSLQREQKKDDEKQLKNHFADVLGEVCKLGDSALLQTTALRKRQSQLIVSYGAGGWTAHTVSTSPFATGLGNEHPIENGFAFLTPYGLPYLAGSGVKGVLRRAAEELVLQDQGSGWTWLDLWWLFGFEGAAGALWEQGSEFAHAYARDVETLARRDDLRDFIAVVISDKGERARFADSTVDRRSVFLERLADKDFRQSVHYRGALDFWDVFPSPKADRLVVEIMTPHFGEYYRGKATPHDAGQPVPVSFLAVPAGSAFSFHAVCHVQRLSATVHERWRSLLDAAAAHAFEWVGFGAKTSVGYGAMRPRVADQRAASTSGAAAAVTTLRETWDNVRLEWSSGSAELRASSGALKAAAIKGQDAARALFEDPAAFERLLKKKELKGMKIDVERAGNLAVVLRVLA